jgi:serine/threonine protein kinase
MSYVDGPSLDKKIRERPLQLDEACDIAIQTAQGLHAAHEKGTVHRDIKSANLLLTKKGEVKITDFGMARFEDRAELTKPGATLGAPAYMSPEQALGKVMDRRTDIWSLGVVIYEMVAGRLPFDGEVEYTVLYGILNGGPPALRRFVNAANSSNFRGKASRGFPVGPQSVTIAAAWHNRTMGSHGAPPGASSISSACCGSAWLPVRPSEHASCPPGAAWPVPPSHWATAFWRQ